MISHQSLTSNLGCNCWDQEAWAHSRQREFSTNWITRAGHPHLLALIYARLMTYRTSFPGSLDSHCHLLSLHKLRLGKISQIVFSRAYTEMLFEPASPGRAPSQKLVLYFQQDGWKRLPAWGKTHCSSQVLWFTVLHPQSQGSLTWFDLIWPSALP